MLHIQLSDAAFRLVVVGLSALLILIFYFYSQRIDFHADEAIYFSAIPVSMRADTGLAFNLAYYPAYMLQSIELARLISCLFGAGIFTCVALLPMERNGQRLIFCALAFLLFALSYPAIFSSVRVRPEISWLFTAAGALTALASYFHSGNRVAAAIAIAFTFILGMNHKLSWLVLLFICAFIAIETVRTRRLDLWLAGVGMAACAGPIANQLIRALLLDAGLQNSLQMMTGSPTAERSDIFDYINLLFYDSALFLGDYAATPTLFQQITGNGAQWLTDHFIANSYMAIAFILPFLSRNFYQFVLFSLPLYFLFLFWFLGYFNPTYAPFIVQFIALSLLYIALSSKGLFVSWRGVRYAAAGLVCFYILIGISFLSARVLAFGPTSTFSLHQWIEEELKKTSETGASRFALPERFQNAAPRNAEKVQVLFKDQIDPDIDIVVYDEYDRLMYTFVPDYKEKLAQLRNITGQFCPISVKNYLVYPGGRSYPNFSERMGSWFFRHSAGNRLQILRRC